MPDWALDILKGLVPAVLVATVTSIIAVKLAINRFRQEKWWEKKEEMYSELLGTLHHLKKYASEHLDRYHDPNSISDEKQKELEAIWRESSAKLSRLEDLASFHLSQNAVSILANYRKQRTEARNENDFYNWIESSLYAADQCLEALKQEAKRDLRIK